MQDDGDRTETEAKPQDPGGGDTKSLVTPGDDAQDKTRAGGEGNTASGDERPDRDDRESHDRGSSASKDVTTNRRDR